MAYDLFFGKITRDWSCGSVLLPSKQQRQIFEKIDDVRYDVRRAGVRVGAAVYALSAAVGLVAVSGLLRAKEK